MKASGSLYSFNDLMKHIGMNSRVEHDGREQYTFVPVQYRGK